MTHRLKTWPVFFQAIQAGIKTFELRRNDRGFDAGDVLVLEEFDPNKNKYTGQVLRVKVTYILNGSDFGLLPEYCIMSIKPQQQ